jgi:hypothetical protein
LEGWLDARAGEVRAIELRVLQVGAGKLRSSQMSAEQVHGVELGAQVRVAMLPLPMNPTVVIISTSFR